jgi:hypothetical protein
MHGSSPCRMVDAVHPRNLALMWIFATTIQTINVGRVVYCRSNKGSFNFIPKIYFL